jgi:hypothetical protein
MAYRFFEAAKEGEYEYNLRILAEFLRSELNEDEPDPSGFSRMARRLEGLSRKELQVIALINASCSTIVQASNDAPTQTERPFVSATQLLNERNNGGRFDRYTLQETLTELASRGLLVPDGASRLSKSEEYYYTSSNFMALISKAREAIAEASRRPGE